MRLSRRLARVESAVPPPPPPPPPLPDVDEQKVVRALIGLAEGDEAAADRLTEEERRAMREGFPSVEAIRAYLDGMRRRPKAEGSCD
jgi:hypothetical protein